MADYFWIQGLIKKPSLHLLARACLNIVANKWAKLEEENYNQYVGRVVEEAEALSRQPASPCTSNPPYCGSIEAPPDSQHMRKPAFTFGGKIPDTWTTYVKDRSSMVVGWGLDITAASKGSGNKLVVAVSLPKG